jgi:hypothetical protein
MIYDRTIEDVILSKEIRKNKIQKGEILNQEDIYILERGTITINTLNRIERKQEELKQLLTAAGYRNVEIINREWGYLDFFDKDNFERILSNLNILKRAFFVYYNTPDVPLMSYNYENINDMEKILYDIEEILINMQNKYRHCGEFQCGEVNKN